MGLLGVFLGALVAWSNGMRLPTVNVGRCAAGLRQGTSPGVGGFVVASCGHRRNSKGLLLPEVAAPEKLETSMEMETIKYEFESRAFTRIRLEGGGGHNHYDGVEGRFAGIRRPMAGGWAGVPNCN